MYSVVHEEIADGIVWCNLIVQMVQWGAPTQWIWYIVVHQKVQILQASAPRDDR